MENSEINNNQTMSRVALREADKENIDLDESNIYYQYESYEEYKDQVADHKTRGRHPEAA